MAGLALAAIWLSIAAPVVSRLLSAPAAASAMSDMACAEHMGHAADSGKPHPNLPSTDKCGYCTLIGYSPFLVAAAWVPALLPRAAYPPPHLPDERHLQRISPLAPTPRGPPGFGNA